VTAASPRIDLRAAAWWVGLGALAGAVGGFVWGAVGGRLVMLALRFTSSDGVRGVETDDGFEIGTITAGGSLFLAAVTTIAGAFAGVTYVAVRTGLPRVARAPIAALFAGAVGGAAFVSPDGIDQRILDPRWLTVGAFVLLPAAAALTFALIVERLGRHGRRVTPPAPRALAVATTAVVTLAAVAAITAGAVELADVISQVA
jgi:hypothetical protein